MKLFYETLPTEELSRGGLQQGAQGVSSAPPQLPGQGVKDTGTTETSAHPQLGKLCIHSSLHIMLIN